MTIYSENKAPLSFRPGLTLVLLWSGLVLMEAVSNHVLPVSLQEFTDDAFVIGLVLSVNPLFGILVQPLVGFWGDRIWTPLGRRLFFIKVATPPMVLCLILFPEAESFLLLVSLVIVFHFLLDVVYGADHPLLADLIPNNKRSWIMGWMLCIGQITQFLFLRFVLGSFDGVDDLGTIYRISAGAALVLLFVASFLVKERPPEPNPKKISVKEYFVEFWSDRVMRSFGILSIFRSAGINGILGYIVLHVVNQMRIDEGNYAQIWSVTSVIYIFCSVPLGVIVEKYIPKNAALMIAYMLIAASAMVAFFGHNSMHLMIVAILFGLGSSLDSVTIKPFYTDFMPLKKLGQFSGALNICYGFGRLMVLVVCGGIVQLFGNDYSAVWPVIVLCMLIASVLSFRIKDERYRSTHSTNGISLD